MQHGPRARTCECVQYRIGIALKTNNADSWKIIMEDASNTVNQSEPGIFDVRSGSEKTSLEGTPYSEW